MAQSEVRSIRESMATDHTMLLVRILVKRHKNKNIAKKDVLIVKKFKMLNSDKEKEVNSTEYLVKHETL